MWFGPTRPAKNAALAVHETTTTTATTVYNAELKSDQLHILGIDKVSQ